MHTNTSSVTSNSSMLPLMLCYVLHIAAGVSTVGGVTFSGGSQKAACLDITAAANNPTKKPLYNADVFGRVYDTNGEAAIDDVSSTQ